MVQRKLLGNGLTFTDYWNWRRRGMRAGGRGMACCTSPLSSFTTLHRHPSPSPPPHSTVKGLIKPPISSSTLSLGNFCSVIRQYCHPPPPAGPALGWDSTRSPPPEGVAKGHGGGWQGVMWCVALLPHWLVVFSSVVLFSSFWIFIWVWVLILLLLL